LPPTWGKDWIRLLLAEWLMETRQLKYFAPTLSPLTAVAAVCWGRRPRSVQTDVQVSLS